MANIPHRTATPTKSKPQKVVAEDNRPRNPYPDCPLTPRPTGRWCKKIKGKLWYFGTIGDWQAALENYKTQIVDILAGRTPEARTKDGLRLLDLCNRWLHHQRQLVVILVENGTTSSSKTDNQAMKCWPGPKRRKSCKALW
jgi:hypothetical protein